MGVTIATKLTTGDKTAVTFPSSFGDYKSLTITNTHTSAVNVSLWLTARQASNTTDTNVTDTGTNINYGSGYAVTTSSQAVVVDGTAATSDIFLNEKVYKSDGTLFGTCTVFTDANNITFGDGINEIMADDADLYVGTIYHIIKAIPIPAATSLKLEADEFMFNSLLYVLYAKSSNASGLIDIIIR